MKRPALSLKGQGLALLARREHSRAELRGKLLLHARKLLAADAEPSATSEPANLAAQVDAVLDWLQAQHFQSDARFVEARVNSRSARHGQARIRMELSRLGVEMDADTAAALRSTELQRAREVWRRRYGTVAAEPAEQARQMRFLAARGFNAEVVRRVVGGRDDEAC